VRSRAPGPEPASRWARASSAGRKRAGALAADREKGRGPTRDHLYWAFQAGDWAPWGMGGCVRAGRSSEGKAAAPFRLSDRSQGQRKVNVHSYIEWPRGSHLALACEASRLVVEPTPDGRFQRAIQRGQLFQAELAARELGARYASGFSASCARVKRASFQTAPAVRLWRSAMLTMYVHGSSPGLLRALRRQICARSRVVSRPM
jgi:hypothetical protein